MLSRMGGVVLPVACVSAVASAVCVGGVRRDGGPRRTDRTVTTECIVIGAGVAGVSTAYAMGRRGIEVRVLEASVEAGCECSAVTAGGMQRSNKTVSAGLWWEVLVASLPGLSHYRRATDPAGYRAIHVRWFDALSDPHFWRWVAAFSRATLLPLVSEKAANEHQERLEAMIEFTCWAIERTTEVLAADDGAIAAATGYSNEGALQLDVKFAESSDTHTSTSGIAVHSSKDDVVQMALARAGGKLKDCNNATTRSREPAVDLSAAECRALEPWLGEMERKHGVEVQGGLFQYECGAANSEKFTKALSRLCSERFGVQFEHGVQVRRLVRNPDSGRICRIETDSGVIEVGKQCEVIVAAGSWTPTLLWTCGLFAPVIPMKGYSIAAPVGHLVDSRSLPARTVFDKYMYVSRLGDEVRVASIAEFGSFDTSPTPAVDKAFREQMRIHAPTLVDVLDKAPTRCGLRPFVADGAILLGKADATHCANLSINVGPGYNGWKICVGGGELLARAVLGEDLSDLPFDVDMVDPKGRVARTSSWWSSLAYTRRFGRR